MSFGDFFRKDRPNQMLPRRGSPLQKLRSWIAASLELYMKRRVAVESASALIDERIKELGDWRGKTLAKVRQVIHEADPEIVEAPSTSMKATRSMRRPWRISPAPAVALNLMGENKAKPKTKPRRATSKRAG
jgi:hypothetical protein